ncbi:MAG TPA: hypothetical protein VK819_01145 [Acidobacteriaceae bacterium]|jgi:hypothetical protein|nr:hypothetical protein [Acidobacteriaceae bacterium]
MPPRGLIAGIARTALIAAALGFHCASSHTQTLTLHLLNGKSGKPMNHKKVTFNWYGTSDFLKSEIAVDAHGNATVTVPAGANGFSMLSGPRMHGDVYRVAFIQCNANSSPISVSDVVKHGVVPDNECGQARVPAKSGEVVFWGKPLPWWMPDMQ